VDQSTIDLKNQQELLDKLTAGLTKLQDENEVLTEKMAQNKEAQAAAQAEIDAQKGYGRCRPEKVGRNQG
jgi:hypothetical protein